MIVEYIRYRIAEPRHTAFQEAYQRAAGALGRAEQCVDFELARCTEDPDAYILRIGWTSTKDHLEGFRKGEHFAAFLAEVEPYLEAVREMRHYEVTAVAGRGGSTPTLYEWAGGAPAFDLLFRRFYEHVEQDELLAPVFAGKDPRHAEHVAAWLGEVFGGPARYSAEHGGHRHMASRHLGLALSERQRRRWVSLLADTADEVGLPGDPEFRAVFAYYLEWGTRMALVYSGPQPPPPAQAPMPRWDWGITPPYRG
ncbi:group II truncated hemoglobin [Streptacidiphilus sp. P02-A3a]|uniref:group II truncated hemoglobin n=1 Tax=Streptacidiphilus sp. P02-A3a TaxID=2704468 RepID=UPI0015FD6BDE|nr:antibiotic biosynthesis monooxygenase [Streptacidiphilus sp. P02-A3a]QMU70082.1 antibiotic biosynthesis monooxygenase [Streptacidiphilus sp. P02-A3a]QMU70465.1 antibiotic biosynthesis monooxygenase [Streptacidiphilus sp. P02-A3a]